MSIVYKESSKEFHIFNDQISYIIGILKNGHLAQRYFGKHLHEQESFAHMTELARRDMAPCTFTDDDDFSLEHIRQEYPVYGNGDMRMPAYGIHRRNGSELSDFVYVSHRIFDGKPVLQGLPSTYTEQAREAQTLEIELCDKLTGELLTLSYSIYQDMPVIARNARFKAGTEPFTLTSAMSLSVDLPESDYEMIDLAGAWGRERQEDIHKLHKGIQSVYSMRGHSSHQFNPFIGLKRPNADEMSGEVIGLSLIYSGNFLAQAEVDNFDVTRLMIGIHPMNFNWDLHQGESFQTPEAILVYSDQGMNGMSQTFHQLFRTRLIRGNWKNRPRPILINNWEATYMKFNEEKIISLARKAADLGIELFVLDDGWFGHRNDDRTSLGDWFANKEKLLEGIEGLSEKIRALGIKFGLWIEPEMISIDSELYREHPDWLMREPGREPCQGRHQYVLDLTRRDIVDAIADRIISLLDKTGISYIKWDMNRSLTDVYSIAAAPEAQGRIFHSYVLGVYALYEKLISRFPDILFESCCSGGGRFDPGILYYAPQAWTSDDTDAVERIRIQYGTSLVYPLSCMCNHVSAVPNHQAFRITPLETRAAVAYFGIFGYELDLNKLTQQDCETIRDQIVFVKKEREFMASGTFYRLISPFGNEEAAWMVVSPDRRKAIVAYYRMQQPVNIGYKRLHLAGLDCDSVYSISDRTQVYYGDELMQAGFDISDSGNGPWTPKMYQGDYQARIFVITAVK